MNMHMAHLQPIAATGRREEMLKSLAELIQRAVLQPGQKLPTERQLMGALKAGRSTIREGIRHLQALDIVEIRRGNGTFLKRPISASTIFMPLSITASRDALLQTLEVRRGLEVEAGALAALRATAGDLEIVGHNLAVMEAAHHAHGTAGPEDLVFHLSVYEASGNPLFGQILQQMREAFSSFFAQPFQRPDFAGRSFPLHRDLFEAIARRDPQGARDHTLAILKIVEEDIIEMSHGNVP